MNEKQAAAVLEVLAKHKLAGLGLVVTGSINALNPIHDYAQIEGAIPLSWFAEKSDPALAMRLAIKCDADFDVLVSMQPYKRIMSGPTNRHYTLFTGFMKRSSIKTVDGTSVGTKTVIRDINDPEISDIVEKFVVPIIDGICEDVYAEMVNARENGG